MKKLVGINRTLLPDNDKEMLLCVNNGNGLFIDIDGMTEKEMNALALCLSKITQNDKEAENILINSKIFLYEQQDNIYFVFMDIDSPTIHKKWFFLIDHDVVRFDLSEHRQKKNGFFDFLRRIEY